MSISKMDYSKPTPGPLKATPASKTWIICCPPGDPQAKLVEACTRKTCYQCEQPVNVSQEAMETSIVISDAVFMCIQCWAAYKAAGVDLILARSPLGQVIAIEVARAEISASNPSRSLRNP